MTVTFPTFWPTSRANPRRSLGRRVGTKASNHQSPNKRFLLLPRMERRGRGRARTRRKRRRPLQRRSGVTIPQTCRSLITGKVEASTSIVGEVVLIHLQIPRGRDIIVIRKGAISRIEIRRARERKSINLTHAIKIGIAIDKDPVVLFVVVITKKLNRKKKQKKTKFPSEASLGL